MKYVPYGLEGICIAFIVFFASLMSDNVMGEAYPNHLTHSAMILGERASLSIYDVIAALITGSVFGLLSLYKDYRHTNKNKFLGR